MSGSAPIDLDGKVGYHLPLLCLATVVAFLGAAQQELYGIYVFYAGMARRVAEDGMFVLHYPFDHNAGAEYPTKGPLFFWLGGLTMRGLGVNAFAATFWVRLAAIGCILATFALGRRLFGRDAGWWAAIFLLSAAPMIEVSTRFRHDAGMVLGYLLALLGCVAARDRAWGPWCCTSGIALAVMTKGLAGLSVLGLVACWWAVDRSWRRASPRAALRWCAAATVLVPALLWHLGTWYRLGDALIANMGEEAVRTGSGSLAGTAAYLGRKALAVYWLPLAALGAVAAIRARRRLGPRRSAAILVLVVWSVVALAAALAKNTHAARYLVPALPPLALLAGWAVARYVPARITRRTRMALLAVGVVAMIALPFTGRFVRDSRAGIASMRATLDAGLPPGAMVDLVRHDPSTVWWDLEWVAFHLDRRGLASSDVAALPAGRLVLIPRPALAALAASRPMEVLARARSFTLVRLGATTR